VFPPPLIKISAANIQYYFELTSFFKKKLSFWSNFSLKMPFLTKNNKKNCTSDEEVQPY